MSKDASNDRAFGPQILVIGAHVDLEGHLLGPKTSLTVSRQMAYVRELDAIEVARDEVFDDWSRGGIKQQENAVMLRGSDCHDPVDRREVDVSLYLPDVSVRSMKHAFALSEASLVHGEANPPSPYVIERLEVSDGLYGEQKLAFVERANAIIGPPNAGKSLIIDCIKFVFGIECQIAEVETVTERRLQRCLPKGTTVSAVVLADGERVTLTRTVGGADCPSPPFKPIVFSQTELVRRSHELSPSIRLLDVHCRDVYSLEQEIVSDSAAIAPALRALLGKADEYNSLVKVTSNTEDGLAATEAELSELTASEPSAVLATAISKVQNWRETVESAVDDWLFTSEEVGPEIPPAPDGLDESYERFVPKEVLAQLVADHEASVDNVRSDFATSLKRVLGQHQGAFEETRDEVDSELSGAGFAEGSELMKRLGVLRERLTALEAQDKRMKLLGEEIDRDLVELRSLVDRVARVRSKVTEVRKAAATAVNKSMRSVFAVVTPDGDPAPVDAMIDGLKTGTYLRGPELVKTREDLDRAEILEFAVRIAQGRVATTDSDWTEQQKISANALSRNLVDDLAALSACYPGDGLDLRRKMPPGTPPVSFCDLTEGLRALAIKEISFAASDLPVISDQPEDAVPTKSVYESLVPTIRTQRAIRQFIVVSHDANIVVASDVEHVNAIRAGVDGENLAGDLFDRQIRDLALEHLEGGLDAFERRSAHYSRS